MSSTHRVGLLLVVVIAFVLGNALAGAQVAREKPAVQQWEHAEYSGLVDESRHAFGDDGWELVAVTKTDRGPRTCYFKRPKK